MREIILAHMGSPSNPKEARLFLENIFKDRGMMKLPAQGLLGPVIAALRAEKSAANYERAGWAKARLLTESLASMLSKKPEIKGFKVRCLYTHLPPYIEEAGAGALVLPLYPHYSFSLAGLMEKRLPQAKVIKEWHGRAGFLDLMREKTGKAMAALGDGKKTLLFIAHSLPEALVKQGDPYIAQAGETFRALAAAFPGMNSRLAYIGQAGPVKWAGQKAKDAVREAANQGEKIAAVYISFPLDNIEVSYDIDIVLAKEAEKYGAPGFVRAGMPNDSPEFALLLEKIILENS